MKKLLPIILVLLFVVSGCGKATKVSVEAEIDKGNYKSAVKDFKDLSQEEKTQITDKFKSEIEALKTKFAKGEIDEIKATEALTEIKLADGMTELADKSLTFIKNVSKSKAAYKTAKSAEDSGDNIKAIEEYSNVIKDDITNYDIAQAKLNQLGEVLKKDQKLEVQSVGIVPDYFKVNDNIQVIVKNTSDKVVKEFTVGIALYDENGYPIKSGILANDSHIFGGRSDNANIQPGKIYGSDNVWNVYTDYGKVKKAIACIKTVGYYDGTQWENPYYKVWYNKYYEKPLQQE